ncbi:hypothetical protein [Salininema proteolyticum]|uniref:Secreted protein n=1 Tax=Salininema proteolyticum TaxID=1607685 RepID=A0ABV8TTR8_9ACTN
MTGLVVLVVILAFAVAVLVVALVLEDIARRDHRRGEEFLRRWIERNVNRPSGFRVDPDDLRGETR